MHLGLGLGLSKRRRVTVSANSSPTAISLSRNTVPEDLAVGLYIGTLSTTDADAGDTFTYSIVSDASGKFSISSNELVLSVALDYETATSHSVTIRSTDAAGASVQQAFTITVTDIVEDTHDPDLPASAGTLVYDGGFTVNPSKNNSGSVLKLQGKSGGLAKFIFDIGVPVAGTTYTMRYDPDFTLLSNTGKEAFVGFGFKKSNNDFHFTGLKGDGATGLNAYKIYGAAKFNVSSGFTTVDDGAAAFGTQAGPNWLQLAIASDGSTYTLRTSSDGQSWTDEFTAATPSPLTNSTDATTFGIAVFLESSDKGQFSIDIQVWAAVAALDSFYYIGQTSNNATYSSAPIGTARADRVIVVGLGIEGSAVTNPEPTGVTVGGVSLTRGSLSNSGTWFGSAIFQRVEVYYGLVPTGTVADIIATVPGAVQVDILAGRVYNCSATPLDQVFAARETDTDILLTDIQKAVSGAIVTIAGANIGTVNMSASWNGAETPSEDREQSSASGNSKWAMYSIKTTAALGTNDLTINLDASRSHSAYALSFGP